MLIIFQFYLVEKIIYSHHILEGRRFGTFIGLLWLCVILAFKLKTILGNLALWRIVSSTIIDGTFRWQGFRAPDTEYHLPRTEMGWAAEGTAPEMGPVGSGSGLSRRIFALGINRGSFRARGHRNCLSCSWSEDKKEGYFGWLPMK